MDRATIEDLLADALDIAEHVDVLVKKIQALTPE
jgi:hypothetical protein